jgi:hypothetical protein
MPSATAQTVTDRTVATVSNGARAIPDLITYSDLIWQLALEPDRPLNDHPTSAELNQALVRLEDQLLILEEARKMPIAESAEAQKDFEEAVAQKKNELARLFGGSAQFMERMSHVGLTTEHLNEILRDRVTTERYLDFRFKAFVLPPGPTEISERYNKKYGPLRNGVNIVPTLEQVRSRIEEELINEKIADEIDKFIDNLRNQPSTEIIVLSPV